MNKILKEWFLMKKLTVNFQTYKNSGEWSENQINAYCEFKSELEEQGLINNICGDDEDVLVFEEKDRDKIQEIAERMSIPVELEL
jgi:hypothetical protein